MELQGRAARPPWRSQGLGLACSDQDLGFRVWGLGFRVWGLGFRVWGLGFSLRVPGLGETCTGDCMI